MSYTQAEQSVVGMTNLSHKYIRPDDTVDRSGLLTMLKGNFPDFLKVCDQKGKDYLPHIFEKRDKKEGKKIQFSKFQIARDCRNQSHGEMPCSGEGRGPSPA